MFRLWPLLVQAFNCFPTTKDKVYKAQYDLVGQDYVEPTYFSRFLGPLLPVLKETPFSPVPQPICPPFSVSTFSSASTFLMVLPVSPSQPRLLPVPSSSVPTFNSPACPRAFALAGPPAWDIPVPFFTLPSPRHPLHCSLKWTSQSRLSPGPQDEPCSRTALWTFPLQYYHNVSFYDISVIVYLYLASTLA